MVWWSWINLNNVSNAYIYIYVCIYQLCNTRFLFNTTSLAAMPRNLFLSALVTSSNYSTLRIGCKAKPVLIKLTCQRNQRKIEDRWLQWLHRLEPMFSLTSAFECAQKPFVGRLLGIMEFVLLWGKNVDTSRQIESNCTDWQYISLKKECTKQESPMLPNVESIIPVWSVE